MTSSVPPSPVLSGHSRLAGVVGWPVAHSLSPRVHGYWLNRYSIDGAYMALPVHPDQFETAIRGLAAAGFRGVNVTVPHKEAAFAISDTIDPAAQRMGAVNTLVFQNDGTLTGSNTDGLGFIENLRSGAPHWDPSRPVALYGAGGAARGILFALIDAGCQSFRIVNRSIDRAETLAAAASGVEVSVHTPAEIGVALADAALVVNATSLGMTGQPPLTVDIDASPPDAVVIDSVYAPLETPLLASARASGRIGIDGLGMLLHQARPGFSVWFGQDPVVDEGLRTFVLKGQ